jgi:hypothetical protein
MNVGTASCYCYTTITIISCCRQGYAEMDMVQMKKRQSVGRVFGGFVHIVFTSQTL